MNVDPRLLQIHAHDEPGYLPLVDYGAWRVAVLNFCDDLRPENLTRLQRHDETDEVFVLLRGRCILFIGDGDDTAGTIHPVDMAPGRLYNVRRGTWHTHTLSADGSVLVVENRDTTLENSPFCAVPAAGTAAMVAHARRLLERPRPDAGVR